MSNQNQPYGVDISKHNGTVNFDKLAKATPKVQFIAMRSGISWGYEDPEYVTNMAGAKRLGLPRIIYHVPYFSEDAKKQVDHIMRLLEKGGFDTRYDRVAMDAELNNGMTKAGVTDKMAQLLAMLRTQIGRYPMIYSRASWVDVWLDVNKLPKVDWWLAHYLKPNASPAYTPEMTTPPALPKDVNTWLIHQTGEKGNGSNVGVVSHYVDTNRWNGTQAELLDYFGLTEETPEPEPETPLFKARVYSWATPYVNIRKGTGMGFAKVGQAYPNSNHDVFEIVGEWYRIQGGYIMSKYLESLTVPEEPETETPLYQAIVTTVPPNRLRVRRTPNGTFVRWLISGETVNVYQETNGWLRIGVGEWSSADYLQRVFDQPDLMNVPLYSQRDPRWANDKMGSSNITMGQQGCLATVTSSGLTYLGYPIDPKEYNKQASAKGGYQAPNLMYWQFPDVLTGGKAIRAEYSGWYANGKGWESLVDGILNSGRPVWAYVDFNRETAAIEQHWVLIIGKNQYGYWVFDPWIGATANLTARYDGLVFRVVSYRRVK